MTTKRTLKFGTDAFLKKTPSLYRRIGNMFFSISSLGGTFAFLLEDKRIGIALFAMAVLGKALTEFFSEEELEKDFADDSDTEADASTVIASLTSALPDVVTSVTEDKEEPAEVVKKPVVPIHINPVDDAPDNIYE